MTDRAERRALITGAGGFVGRWLAAGLHETGWETVGADRTAPEGPGRGAACDLADREQVRRMVAEAGPLTHVFHLAAVTFVPDAARNPAQTFEVNLLGTVHLVAALLEHCPEARLVFIGSSEVYGIPVSLPVTEEHPVNPANPYAISKAAADAYCAWAHRACGLDVVRVRPFNHSGPGQAPAFVLPDFAAQIARIERSGAPGVIRVGNLDRARDFLHVRDVVRAYERLALEGVSGAAYNVCSGRAVPVRAALDRLLGLSSAAIRVEPDPDRMRPVDIPEMRGSHARLTRDTGWVPTIDLDTLLGELLEYWRGVVR